MLKRSDREKKASFKVFPASACKSFRRVPSTELSFGDTRIDQVVAVLMNPHWLELIDEKYGKNKISGFDDLGTHVPGTIIQFVRETKTIGPLSSKFEWYCTMWVEEKRDKSIVILHCFDGTEKCHVVSNFVLQYEGEGASVSIRFEELASSNRFASGQSKKAHAHMLQLLGQEVHKRRREAAKEDRLEDEIVLPDQEAPKRTSGPQLKAPRVKSNPKSLPKIPSPRNQSDGQLSNASSSGSKSPRIASLTSEKSYSPRKGSPRRGSPMIGSPRAGGNLDVKKRKESPRTPKTKSPVTSPRVEDESEKKLSMERVLKEEKKLSKQEDDIRPSSLKQSGALGLFDCIGGMNDDPCKGGEEDEDEDDDEFVVPTIDNIVEGGPPPTDLRVSMIQTPQERESDSMVKAKERHELKKIVSENDVLKRNYFAVNSSVVSESTGRTPVNIQISRASNQRQSLKSVPLYTSEFCEEDEDVKKIPKYRAGTLCQAFNLETEKWENAFVVSFNDGFYEIQYNDGTLQCCDGTELKRDSSLLVADDRLENTESDSITLMLAGPLNDEGELEEEERLWDIDSIINETTQIVDIDDEFNELLE